MHHAAHFSIIWAIIEVLLLTVIRYVFLSFWFGFVLALVSSVGEMKFAFQVFTKWKRIWNIQQTAPHFQLNIPSLDSTSTPWIIFWIFHSSIIHVENRMDYFSSFICMRLLCIALAGVSVCASSSFKTKQNKNALPQLKAMHIYSVQQVS